MGAGTNLNWLGEWIAVPGPIGGTYSPGDLVVGLGIGIVAFYATRTPLEQKRRSEKPSAV